MKKIFAISLMLAMLVGILPILSLPATASDIPGDWTTYRAASEYPENSDKPQKPEAGYRYTEEGFTVIPADYTDSTPFMTVQSKEPQPIKEGVYMEFRVDDYCYNGPNHNIDSWICVSITNKPKVVPGATAYGGGMTCLIRGDGGGADAKVECFNTIQTTETSNGSFQNMGNVNIIPGLDDQGRELYTLEVSHNGSRYVVKINGVAVAGMDAITSNLNSMDPNGEFYVGVTLYSSVKDGTAAMSILKYGTDKNHAYVPTGSDGKDPEPNLLKIAEIADPSTVPQNQPALYWDAGVAAAPNGTNIKLTAQGDNTFRAELSSGLGFFSWNMSRNTSYSGTDFPVFNVLLRNYYGDGGNLWYYGGDILGATDQNIKGWNPAAGLYFDGGDDEYVLVSVDLTGYWEGRINGLRFDVGCPDGYREFDVGLLPLSGGGRCLLRAATP